MAENQDVIYGSENGDFWLRKENVDLASMTYLGGSN
jgi:hypothetical protein